MPSDQKVNEKPKEIQEIQDSIQYTLGYMSGFIFLIAIIIYIYFIIVDNLEQDNHTLEETSWIYGFLVLLLLGFISSFYAISRNNNTNAFGKNKTKHLNTIFPNILKN